MTQILHTTYQDELTKIVDCLKSGNIIAYPTESVFGFGCDPFNQNAVLKLLEIKKRSINKGFILIGATFNQLESLIKPINTRTLTRILSTWPGPITWAFPVSDQVPAWIRGQHNSIALRVTAHPVGQAICEAFGGPIISSSANVESFPPARDQRMVLMEFSGVIDAVVAGEVGTLKRPTEIRDAISGEILRQG